MRAFFEEIPLRIHRSHLLQAFLFDHIQPHMPAFNTNIFKLGSTTEHLNQHVYQVTEQSQTLVEEMQKIELNYKSQIKVAKRQNEKIQAQILANRDKTVKGSLAEKEEREALESFKVDDNTYDKMDLFLFSKQVDSLCETLGEFDTCFPAENRFDLGDE
jgi:hypothetical protein